MGPYSQESLAIGLLAYYLLGDPEVVGSGLGGSSLKELSGFRAFGLKGLFSESCRVQCYFSRCGGFKVLQGIHYRSVAGASKDVLSEL